jgi:lipopolysaccharide export system permease protein
MLDYPQSDRQKSKPSRTFIKGGIFHRVLLREFWNTGMAVFVILAAIFIFTQLIRLLGESASGMLTEEGVWALVGFGALTYLPTLLSISLFLSVLLTLTRCYRDSEMVVWFSAGIGLTRWLRPVLSFALPTVLLIALLSLVLVPWAQTKSEELMTRLENRDDLALATPGVFRESKQADRVFFLEQVDQKSKRIGNVFVESKQEGREGTIVAAEGKQEIVENGDRFLVLFNGKRYEGVPGAADFKVFSFERYAMRIEPVESRQRPENVKAYSTFSLAKDLNQWHAAELIWRIGLPISALLLALLAIPLSYVNPRSGRSFNLILALVIYMTYNNLLGFSTSWVGQGKLNMIVGLWAIHGLMVSFLVVFFYYRLFGGSWRRIGR